MDDVRDTRDAGAAEERPDASLMARVAAGDMGALGDLYMRYGRMVFSVLHHHAPWLSAAEMEDICQDVFVTLHKTAKRYQERGKFRAWLCRITIHHAMHANRRQVVRRGLLWRRAEEQAGAAQPSAHPQLEARDALDKALEKLSPSLRQVLLLHAVEGLSGEEIAEALDIKVNAVWTRLHRARQAMQGLLEERA